MSGATNITFHHGAAADAEARRWAKGTLGLRAPHHTTSVTGLVGHGYMRDDVLSIEPGEVHLGRVLLVLDYAEFRPEALSALGIALRDGWTYHAGAGAPVRVRVTVHTVFATARECPCGMRDSTSPPCTCTPEMVKRWHRRRDRCAALLRGERST